jgi:hypothetical protein
MISRIFDEGVERECILLGLGHPDLLQRATWPSVAGSSAEYPRVLHFVALHTAQSIRLGIQPTESRLNRKAAAA